MPVTLTPEALADLRHIREHIGRDNPHAATRVAVQLIAACDRLEYLPERGRRGLVPGTRELASFWPYVIVYRITPAAVEILRIWHGAQDRRPRGPA
jgi:plasmid stabilization system protein ParE